MLGLIYSTKDQRQIKYRLMIWSHFPGKFRRYLSLMALTLSLLMVRMVEAEGLTSRLDFTTSSGLSFQHWGKQKDNQDRPSLSIREFAIPLTFVFKATPRLNFNVTTRLGFANLSEGQSSSLNGPTDTKIRTSYLLKDDKTLVTMGLSTPTGASNLDSTEQEVSRYLVQNAMGFLVPHFGLGWGLDIGLVRAWNVGENVFSLGGNWVKRFAFEPWDEGDETPPDFKPDKYAPGYELNIPLGWHRKVMDRRLRLGIDVLYTLYGDDSLTRSEDRGGNLDPFFSPGSRILVRGQGEYKLRDIDVKAHLIERYKRKSVSYATTPNTTLENGHRIDLGLSAIIPLGQSLKLGATMEFKNYKGNDFESASLLLNKPDKPDDKYEATIYSIGPSLQYNRDPSLFRLNIKYSRGEILGDQWSGIDISGNIWIRQNPFNR